MLSDKTKDVETLKSIRLTAVGSAVALVGNSIRLVPSGINQVTNLLHNSPHNITTFAITAIRNPDFFYGVSCAAVAAASVVNVYQITKLLRKN
jgi:hypothetical protein